MNIWRSHCQSLLSPQKKLLFKADTQGNIEWAPESNVTLCWGTEIHCTGLGRKQQQCSAGSQMHPCQQLIISYTGVWWSAQQAHPWLPWLARQRYCQHKAKFGTPSSCLGRKTIISNTLLHKYLAFCAGDEPLQRQIQVKIGCSADCMEPANRIPGAALLGSNSLRPRKRCSFTGTGLFQSSLFHTLGVQPVCK